MARKKLLTEAEVRRFMKLAMIGPIGARGLAEERYPGQREEEDPMGMGAPEGGEVEMADLEEPAPEPAPEDEMEMDMDMDAEMGEEVSEGDVVDIVSTIADALEDKYGIMISVEGGGEVPEEGGEDEIPGDEEMVPGEEEEDLGGEDEMAFGGEEEEMPEDEMVAEVARRVAARLRESNKKRPRVKRRRTAARKRAIKTERMSEQIADRVFARLSAQTKRPSTLAKAKRRHRANKREQLSEQLAERIFTRLTKK